MPRSYVDNASNRRLGRVGMPVGSMVVSRSSSGGSYGGGSFGNSTKTYVDNSYNRSLGRVGMAHGTAVASRNSSSSSYASAFSTPASGGFGTPSAFGAATPSTNLFGSTSNTNTGTSLFGQNKGFGFSFGNTSNVFGTNTSTASSTGTSLFGTPSASTSFGGFGANESTFGTGTTGGLFGQPTSSSGSLFGHSTNTQSAGLFGATAGAGGLSGASQQTRTTVKFEAPNAQDTMVRNGTTQQVNTRHQVISAMEQYKSKSMEELRIEDYTANRKRGKSTAILGKGLTPQGNKTAGRLFGQATTTTGFSFGTQSKPLFGGTTTAFGTGTTGGLFGQPTSSSGSLFGHSTNTQSAGLFVGATAGAGGVSGASQQTGTTVKFEAPNDQERMVRNGTTQQVNTRHQVISAMEQYKSKSMEELRIEDYTANRKGGTSTGILGKGLTPQGNKTAGRLFGQATTTTGFSFGTQSKPLFGGTTAAEQFLVGGSRRGQQLSSNLENIGEQGEEERMGQKPVDADYKRPQLSDTDEARLHSCLDEIRNIVKETVPEHVMIQTILDSDFCSETALDRVLNYQEQVEVRLLVQQPKVVKDCDGYNDDLYGHSVEDDYGGVSPATAEQFLVGGNHRGQQLSSNLESIGEQDEEERMGQKPVDADYKRPQLSDTDEARLHSCLDEIRNIVKETVPEHVMIQTILDSDFCSETALDRVLNYQEQGEVRLRVQQPKVVKGSLNASSGTETYVDNSHNRSIGRVGKEHGSAVVSKSGTSGSKGSVYPGKVYVDNAMNRRLGRVGKPLGSMPFSKSSSNQSGPGCYVDNAYNRSLGRAGQKRGTMPVSKSQQTKAIEDLYRRARNYPLEDIEVMETDNNEYTCEVVLDLINRLNQVELWQNQTGSRGQPTTSDRLLNDYAGTIIPFEELDLQAKIGSGGFGDVHFARWRESVVAVKKLRVQRVSKKRLKEFTDELLVFCSLKHGNIVKFIGACVVTPNLAIVMEYMDCSLYEAIHVKDDNDFSGKERLSIIRQILRGLKYLHVEQIAHCDLKSRNVLMNLSDVPVAKLTDFGLSMMRVETENSVSAADSVRNIGTPRYSAPEVLRGELLRRRDMMQADMYSVSLVVFEVICEDEPFPRLNYAQLRKHVGEGSVIPDLPGNIRISPPLLRSMKDCWNRKADQRPTAASFLETIGSLRSLWPTHV